VRSASILAVIGLSPGEEAGSSGLVLVDGASRQHDTGGSALQALLSRSGDLAPVVLAPLQSG
jgi:hypothetical protein